MKDGLIRLCVIMATYNRSAITERAVSELTKCSLPTGISMRIVIADSASSDGTAEVLDAFDEVEVHDVGPESYWAQSMRSAWERAKAQDADYVLWLNDDVVLDDDGISRLFDASIRHGDSAVVSGATRGHDGTATYTGYRRGSWGRRLSFTRLAPSEFDQDCDAINGNVVLVPHKVDRALGGFPKGYVHGMADFAFSLNARKRGIEVVLAPGTFGTCEVNPVSGTWRDSLLPTVERWRLLTSPKGLPPRPWWRFCVRYGGVMFLAYFAKPYLTVLLGSSARRLLRATHRSRD